MATTPTKRDIKYINKDFSQFREQLINYAQTYFPQTYTDFSDTSPGMMFMEQAAYVGDVLSFYLDNQFQENFIQYARQSNNIFELAYMFGYKPKISSCATTTLEVYQELPSKFDSGTGTYSPDFDYALEILPNTQFNAVGGITFISEDTLDFSISSSQDPTEITISQVLGGNPQYYLLKKQLRVISSKMNTTTFQFNQPEEFPTVDISSANLVGILDVIDSDGNEWSEVDHLGQEMVFDSIKNTNPNDPNSDKDIPYLLRLKKVQNRFSTRFRNSSTLQLQFGVGSPSNTTEEIIPNPNNVGIGLPFIKNKLTTAYSPTNFLFTGTYGIAPSNTTLTVRYLTGGGVESNISANTISTIENINTSVKFIKYNLSNTTSNYIFNSLRITNPQAAVGGGGGDTLEEIRQNTMMMIASQKRAVTSDDYLIRALSMPSNYGSIYKAHIDTPKVRDNQVSTIETLNLFILSRNSTGALTYANKTLKNNLRTYLSQYRIIGDNIEIRDAFIINISINFEIIVLPEFNNQEVLLNCINKLKNHFSLDKWQINQPILMRDLYVMLDKCKGVQTVKDIHIMNKAGTTSGYSAYAYDIEGATKNHVVYPSLDPSIFEIRYPDTDIKGQVVPL
tara:strand:+ start:5114 stop:6976 length:1863 start_codon:yes stop_codon:yes gene_type:complete